MEQLTDIADHMYWNGNFWQIDGLKMYYNLELSKTKIERTFL